MCLIILCPKGTDKYSDRVREAIENAAYSNDDGMGYSFKRSSTKKVFINKGFTEVETLWKALSNHNLSEEDELMIHLRNGNKGAINEQMCHPFVVSENHDEVVKLKGYVNNPTLVHNGTFTSYSVHNSIYSDTYFFTKDFLSNGWAMGPLKYDTTFFNKYLKTVFGFSKVALLFPGEDIDMKHIGDFINREGYLFSNYSFQDRKIVNIGGVNKATRGSEDYAVDSEVVDWDNDPEYQQYLKSRYGKDNTLTSLRQHQTDKAREIARRCAAADGGSICTHKSAADKEISNDGIRTVSGSHPEDIVVSAFSDCEKFTSANGTIFRLYMGLWIPDSYVTKTQFASCRIDVNYLNYNEFRFVAIEDIPTENIKKTDTIEMITFDDSPEKIHCFKKLYTGSSEFQEVYIQQKELTKCFRSEAYGRHIAKYQDYYKLVKELNVSKTTLNRLSRFLSEDTSQGNETIEFRGLYARKDAFRLFLMMTLKSMFPNEYLGKLSHLESI